MLIMIESVCCVSLFLKYKMESVTKTNVKYYPINSHYNFYQQKFTSKMENRMI